MCTEMARQLFGDAWFLDGRNKFVYHLGFAVLHLILTTTARVFLSSKEAFKRGCHFGVDGVGESEQGTRSASCRWWCWWGLECCESIPFRRLHR